MKIELEDLDAEKSQDFLNYFIAQLKEKKETPFLGSGSAGFNAKGQYESSIDDFIETNSGEGTAVSWKITQNLDGTIPFIEVISQSDIHASECSDHINSFINTVLKLTLAERKNPFYNRSYYCFIHGANLNGEYWINSKLRIAPLYPEDNSSHVNAERIIVIDQIVDAIDETHSRQLSDEQASLLSSQLSFLFDIGMYEPAREERWVINRSEDDGSIENKRILLGVWDEKRPNKMPTKGKICNLSTPVDSVYKYKRSASRDLAFPQETRKILNAIDQTEYKNKLAFNKCCRLYQVALNAGRRHPTIMLSYMCGAVDSIQQTASDENGFSGFMRKYDPSVDDALLDYIHKDIRSAHWHGGEFVMGENESIWKEYLTNPNTSLRFNITRNARKTMRTAILNWVFQEILNEESPHVAAA